MSTHRLVLASASQRRIQLLKSLGLHFSSVAPNIDESRLKGETAENMVRRLAQAKAEEVQVRLNGKCTVLAADTVVALHKRVLGKPRDAWQAVTMLAQLQGREHCVYTGVCILTGENEALLGVERTRVRFAPMSDKEIEAYVHTGEPLDKAGAYGIQGRGALYVQHICGDYYNVVGLPLRLTYVLMRDAGLSL